MGVNRAALLFLLLRGLCAAWLTSSGLAAAEFRAALARVDITPDTPQMLRGYKPRMSTRAHDRLFHRILVLDDGTASFVLISSDLCSLSPAFCDRVTADIARSLGLPPENVWWAVTHTHSSPYAGPPGVPGLLMPDRFRFPTDDRYTERVEKTLAEGVRQARRNLAPARVGTAWGYAEANINRRAHDADGRVRLGMNPSGPVDRRIGLIRLDRAAGGPLALIANYPVHATVLGGESTLVSADAPGAVAAYVEEKAATPLLYLNGAAGNLAPLYSTRSQDEVQLLQRFRALLGDPILEANRRVRAADPSGVELRASRIVVETPKRPGLAWSAELESYRRVAGDGAETLLIPVRFLRVNQDVVIWSAPLELFCEIANEIRDRSPFLHTFYFGYTNGSFGYLPTEREFLAGGYEPETSVFTAAAAGHLSAAVNRHLREISGCRD